MIPTRRELLKAGAIAAAVMAASACGVQNRPKARNGPGTINKSDVPVGGGAIIEGTYYLVTQPRAGVYVGFVRVCKHAGCLVDRISQGVIICPCHGSRYAIADGTRLSGPSTGNLSLAPVKDNGTSLTVGT